MVSRDDLKDAEEQLAARDVQVEYKIEHPKIKVVRFRDPDDVLIQCFYERPDFLESLEDMEPSLALLLV